MARRLVSCGYYVHRIWAVYIVVNRHLFLLLFSGSCLPAHVLALSLSLSLSLPSLPPPSLSQCMCY